MMYILKETKGQEMAKYLALLRGINVGGKNKLPMKSLIEMFLEAGCADVQTYIQSGNVIFNASSTLYIQLPDLITSRINLQFGYKIPVLPTLKFNIDYAMAPFGALGISHTVTVKVRW